jgi:hypothetical protein
MHSAPEGFYFQASNGSVALPVAGYISTTATGLLCWRDSHPLEWQLASLHQTRMCRFPASGSSWESLAHGGVDDTIRDLPAKKDSR